MELLENAVRFSEDYMAERSPLNTVILLYADALEPGSAGQNNGSKVIIHPDF